MFEALNPLPSGAARKRRPGLEALEGRAVPAVIGGIVYHDANGSGLFDAGEAGLPASTLQLRDSAGNVLATTVSGADGRYQFTERTGPVVPGEMTYEATFAPAATDHTRTATLPQFDPALGTLTSVDVFAEGNLVSRVQVENLGGAPAEVSANLKGRFSFQAPGVASLESNPTATVSGSLAAFDGQMDLQGVSARDFGATPLAGQAAPATVTGADLEAYIGTGSVSVSAAASAQTTTSGPGNLLALVNSTASGKVKLVYRYTPSSELGPGQYTVVQATQPAGFADGLDTNTNMTPLPGSGAADAIPVTITRRDEQSLNNNFGEMTAPVRAPVITPVPVGTFPVLLRLSKSFYFGGVS